MSLVGAGGTTHTRQLLQRAAADVSDRALAGYDDDNDDDDDDD